MAENKKSFILYADLIHTVRKMPKDKAGELFLTILSYVNDEDPGIDDLLVEVAFEPVKQQLKRDLKRWEDYRGKQSLNGKKGGRPAKPSDPEPYAETQNNPSLLDESQKSLNVNVNVNANVTDTVSNNLFVDNGAIAPTKIKSVTTLTDREKGFYNSLKTYSGTYPAEMLRAFYDYWREPNKSKTKMRFEIEKTWDLNLRLQKWAKNDFNKPKSFTNGNQPINSGNKPGTSDARIGALLELQ